MKTTKNTVHNWKISIKRVNPLGQNWIKETSSAYKAGQYLKKSGFASDSIGNDMVAFETQKGGLKPFEYIITR
jgi:hypothetical protein